MRTLKKSLALVLALVMVLGLGVVGASADNKLDDYNDLAKLDAQYVEAAGVLTGLGIVAGIDSVTLDPDGYYTREQAAKIITYLLLGETKAEALSCTEDPFDDVAADHWSAKYIAYCAERGIIDGVGGNKFDPYSKLTGYQWAKMLLSAVGFGKNGEFTGDSWSLGTATYAAITDLFEGDETGGDHVALRREQAMLYAFNALNNLGYVTYSEALGDYFWSYNIAVGDRVLPEGSLAWVIWNLSSVEGVIVDNEALGNEATELDRVSGANIEVAADTGLDLLGHFVRQWFIGQSADYTGNWTRTGVYTHDLAVSATKIDCPTVAQLAYTNRVSSAHTDWKLYEAANVDNPAGIADYTVTAYALIGTVEGFYNTADKTVISVGASNNLIVDNDKILNDISGIGRGSSVIVVETEHNCYYIAPLTRTNGHVTSVATATSAVTLSGGTVIAKSNLAIRNDVPTVGKDYYFILDSHGHWVDFGEVTVEADVWYFTGSVIAKPGTHLDETTYTAQAVSTSTGDISYFAVDSQHLQMLTDHDITGPTGYYNVNAPTTNGFYTWAGHGTNLTFNNSTYTATAQDGKTVYYGNTVQFVILTGKGEAISVDTSCTTIAALLAKYNASEVRVNGWVNYEKNAYGTNEVQSVFILSAESTGVWQQYLYVPEDLVAYGDWTSVNEIDGVYYWQYTGAYVNGTPYTITMKTDSQSTVPTLQGGFYEYYEADGVTVTQRFVGYTTAQGVPTGISYTMDVVEGRTYLHTGGYNYDLTDAEVKDLRSNLAINGAGNEDEVTTVVEILTQYNESILEGQVLPKQPYKVVFAYITTADATGVYDVPCVYVID